MFTISTKKLLIIIPLFVALLCILFWRPLVTWGAEKYLRHFVGKVLESDLVADKIYLDKGSFIVEQPRLIGKRTVADGGLALTADRLIIHLIPTFSEGRINVDVALYKPHLDIKQSPSQVDAQLFDLMAISGLMKVHSSLVIREGSVTFHDFEAKEPSSQTYFFQLDAECRQAVKGCLIASLDDPTLKENCVTLSLAQTDDRFLAADFNFKQVECSSLLGAVRSFAPSLKNLNVTSGLITGKMSVTLPKEGKAYAIGSLAIQDVAYSFAPADMQGFIKEAELHLSENPAPNNEENAKTIGHFELKPGSQIVFNREGKRFCEISDLAGSVYFQTKDGARLNFQGQCIHQGKTSTVKMDGEAHFSRQEEASLDLQCKLFGADREETAARFLTRQIGSKFKFAEISFKNVGPSEFDLIRSLLSTRSPEFGQIDMMRGKINAKVFAYLKGLRLTDLKIEKIAGTDLQFHVAPWELAVEAKEVSGELAINLATDKALDTLNADLHITNGQLSVADEGQEMCRLTDVETHLTVRRGVIQNSKVSGELAGLKGTIQLDGLSPDGEIVKMHFSGRAEDASVLTPLALRECFKRTFHEDTIELTAGMRHMLGGMRIEGTLNIKGPQDPYGHTAEFGFDVEKSSRQLWGKWPPHHLAAEFWQEIGLEAFLESMPSIASPLALLEAKWMRRELGIAGFVIRKGWVQAQHLPLEKFITPFVFTSPEITMSGLGDFHGSFDHQGLALNYELHHVKLESPSLTFEMQGSRPEEERDSLTHMPGTHYFDFIQGKSFGILPIHQATYFQKNSGLLFTDMCALISLVDNKMHFNDLQISSTGLSFGGYATLDIINQETGAFDVDLHADTVLGKFSQLQHLLAHFDSTKNIQKYPLDGNIALRDHGLDMHMHFRPERFSMESAVHGMLTEGTVLPHPNSKVNAKGISFKFDYDQAAHTLALTEIEGIVVVNNNKVAEEFALAGDKIHFTNLDRNEATFDIWVGDNKRDIIRLAGKTKTDPQDHQAEFIDVVFDPNLTHFGDVHPQIVELCVKNWTQVQKFRLDVDLSLHTLFHDLLSLSHTGLFLLPSSLQKELDTLTEVKGDFKIHCRYDEKTSAFGYHAAGDNVQIGTHHFKKCLLNGSQKDGSWAIDQLVLDDLSLAADVSKVSQGWKIDFLGIRFGHSLLMGLEGEYRSGENGFDAKINLLEIDLGRLEEWPELAEFVQKSNPKGDLKATGLLRFEIDRSLPKGWRVDVVVNGGIKRWELQGLHLQDISNASFHFATNRGLTIRNIKTGIKDPVKDEVLGLFECEKFEYVNDTNEMSFDGLKFNVPAENIKSVTTLLQKSYPDVFTNGVIATVNDLKHNNNLEGSVAMQKSPSSSVFQVALKEGMYYFNQQPHEVNNFVLTYDQQDLKVLTQYRFQQHLFWLEAFSQGPSFETGVLVLSDQHPQQQPSSAAGRNPLRVEWKRDTHYGFQIERAMGHFCGLHVRLAHDLDIPYTTEAIHLAGEVDVLPYKAAALVSDALQEKMKLWQVGSGYTLNGRWRLDKDIHADESGQLHFHGTLEGHNFVLKGYQFQKLSAWVDYVPASITMRQIHVDDPAGTLHIERADMFKNEQGLWKLSVPLVTVKDLRPSLLQEVGLPPVTIVKPLLVRQLEIHQLHGDCNDSNTFCGTGKLVFVNPPKKNLQNTIFAIPAEILTRIGLDLTVLNPVSGNILFEIKNSKALLTKFKDVYSEGKLSKFQLTHSKHPSYLDFDGNLHVQIRMKQYNLFFKFAELFTVNVGGTLLKPTYSLQQHSNKDQE